MQKLWNLKDWKELRVGKSIHFPVNKPRMLRIDFNSPEPVHVFIKDGEEVIFLARTVGRDTVEFAIDNEFELLLEDGVTYIHIDEGDFTHYVNTSEETFAKIHEPRVRNYEMELANYRIRQHFQTRMDEMDALLDAKFKKRLEGLNVNPVTPEAVEPNATEVPSQSGVVDDTAEDA